jgi:hypothetical protein
MVLCMLVDLGSLHLLLYCLDLLWKPQSHALQQSVCNAPLYTFFAAIGKLK